MATPKQLTGGGDSFITGRAKIHAAGLHGRREVSSAAEANILLVVGNLGFDASNLLK